MHPPRGRSSPHTQAVARVECDGEVGWVATLLRDFAALIRAGGPGPRPDGVAATLLAAFEDWLKRARSCGVETPGHLRRGAASGRCGGACRFNPALEQRTGRGQINRLKMLKRQMYGRAGFDLLRRRVLLAT